ncbi:hypothetical protein DXG03_006590 [Asterophora parasitica]|uniref:Uncharacterized protein n=1 Tax=Asterophora parasitica TaxID=117018 RepID=A0A9P7GAQ9_9AGAR|nr:hypothetical protein DXG03_006590 [Asterophora parasitica]
MRHSYRLGGWVMSNEETISWAARVEKPSEELTFDSARTIMVQYLRYTYNLRISIVYPGGDDWPLLMVVTRRAPHLNWKRGDDPEKLVMEAFKPVKVDVVVGRLLWKQGTSLLSSRTKIPAVTSFLSRRQRPSLYYRRRVVLKTGSTIFLSCITK